MQASNAHAQYLQGTFGRPSRVSRSEQFLTAEPCTVEDWESGSTSWAMDLGKISYQPPWSRAAAASSGPLPVFAGADLKERVSNDKNYQSVSFCCKSCCENCPTCSSVWRRHDNFICNVGSVALEAWLTHLYMFLVVFGMWPKSAILQTPKFTASNAPKRVLSHGTFRRKWPMFSASSEHGSPGRWNGAFLGCRL